MIKKEIIIIADYTQDEALSFEELCEICQLERPMLIEFIQHDIIHPEPENATLFSIAQLQRLQKALRLQRDFELNLEGIVVVLDLLEELEILRDKRL